MHTAIKKIRNIIVGNIVILGLVACSSAPAPWTQVDDSPWGSKRKAESLSNDTALMVDPVLLGETESTITGAITPEVIDVQPEEITPVVVDPEVIEHAAHATVEAAVIEPQSTEQELLGLPASDYAVQVFAGNTLDSIEKFKNTKGVYELKTVATSRSGSIMYVLVDIYSDRAAAYAAAKDLASRTGTKPWVRSLAGLQKIIVQ